jgi:parallel beta-helix repeat protein
MGKTPRLSSLVLGLLILAACASAATATGPGSPALLSPATVAPIQPPLPQTLAAGPAAQTYYVAMGGDDGNDGSAGTPWATLQHAVDSIAPGDTIMVRAGEYQGCRIEQSGTASAWMTLQAEPGATVRVTSPGPNNQHESNVEVETWEGDGIVAYWVIQGLEVSGASRYGIDVRGSHDIAIRYNRVHDNGLSTGRTGIFLAFVDDAVIEFNESYNNGEHGIYCSNSGDWPVVRGNVLHHNAGCGVHMNGDVSMGGDGTISHALVERNVIYENGTAGGAAINMDGVEDSIVRNNLLHGNHAGGIAIFQQDGAICSRSNLILNNTIVMPADGRWAVNIAKVDCVGNVLLNNILLTYHPWRGSITIPAGLAGGLQSDFNIVMDRFSADGDSTVITLAEWQALGYDTHSFTSTTDLLFVNEVGADYRLLPGCPAVDAGVTLGDNHDDLTGAPRPWGPAYDIGAYEYREQGFTVFLPLLVKG